MGRHLRGAPVWLLWLFLAGPWPTCGLLLSGRGLTPAWGHLFVSKISFRDSTNLLTTDPCDVALARCLHALLHTLDKLQEM